VAALLNGRGREAVFALIRRRRQTTRTDVAETCGLSKAQVSDIVAELLAEGLVREVGTQQEGRGRSRIVLELNAMAYLVLGAQLDDDRCVAILADLQARPQAMETVAVHGQRPGDFVQALATAVERLRSQTTTPIVGLGVGTPGSLDAAGRVIRVSVPHGWRDIPIADMVETHIGLPTRVANRAKVAVLGEHWHGRAQGVEDVAYVFVGNGIIAGLLVDGKLYFGAGGAGELGHLTVVPDGPICGCGNRGCLHTFASGSAIVRLAHARAREDAGSLLHTSHGGLVALTLDDVLHAARLDDEAALAAIGVAGVYLGIAIANLVNLVHPRMVVIGGPVGRLGEPAVAVIRREVQRRALADILTDLEIVPTALGDEAGAIGAAAYFLDQWPSLALRRERTAPPSEPSHSATESLPR
jgi:predicted NBD/HSP70 family sugar kinase